MKIATITILLISLLAAVLSALRRRKHRGVNSCNVTSKSLCKAACEWREGAPTGKCRDRCANHDDSQKDCKSLSHCEWDDGCTTKAGQVWDV